MKFRLRHKAILTAIAALWAGTAMAEHMLSTRWTQNEPYNKHCPVDREGQLTPPGCAAVAMGQILFYHKPSIGADGTVDYTYNVSYGTNTVEESMALNLEDMEIDPSQILNQYTDGNYSEAQGQAVADFLLRTGAGMFMQYRADGSSPKNNGSQLWGMHHHLKISPKAEYRYRENYSTEEWKRMIDNELESGRPVYYGGGWYHYNSAGSLVRVGHFFVIDGKNPDGTYSINWGNNYKGDAVDLEILNQNPKMPYLGGQAVSYHTRQCMIINLVPVAEDEHPLEQGLICTMPLVLNGDADLSSVALGADRKFKLGFRVQNYYGEKAGGIRDAIGLWPEGQEDAEPIIVGQSSSYSLGPGYWKDVNRSITLPEKLPDGSYTARLMSFNIVSGQWQPFIESAKPNFSIVKNRKETVVSVPRNYLGPSSLWLREEITEVENPYGSRYPGTVFSMKIANTSPNNFQDSLRVNIASDGRTVSLPYYMSVYEGCDMNLQYLVPESAIDLRDKDYTLTVDYYDSYRGEYRRLGVGESSAISLPKVPELSECERYEIYSLGGTLVKTGRGKPSCSELPPAFYIIRQSDSVSKVCRR